MRNLFKLELLQKKIKQIYHIKIKFQEAWRKIKLCMVIKVILNKIVLFFLTTKDKFGEKT